MPAHNRQFIYVCMRVECGGHGEGRWGANKLLRGLGICVPSTMMVWHISVVAGSEIAQGRCYSHSSITGPMGRQHIATLVHQFPCHIFFIICIF